MQANFFPATLPLKAINFHVDFHLMELSESRKILSRKFITTEGSIRDAIEKDLIYLGEGMLFDV